MAVMPFFTAEYKDGEIVNGTFYSGAHWQEDWKAVKMSRLSCAMPARFTKVIDYNTKPNFSFPFAE